MMKRPVLLLLCLCFCLSYQVSGKSKVLVKPEVIPAISLFSLSDVRLYESEFKHIMERNHAYLLSLSPDRLASWFRREAGLTPKAQPYPFWESENVWGGGPLAGHIMGFYLSSMSMMYESTGDTVILNRLVYTLNELNECQRAQGDGYLLATINGRHVFEDVVEGNFTTSNPLINDTWEPVYIMNKIMLGLYGVYIRCELLLAKDILIRMADWFGSVVVDKLSHDDLQKLLICEHGSINESYINVYMVTGDTKYLEWAKRLNDEDMWVPMSKGEDILEGWHANTQIPKFTGFENVFRYTKEEKYTRAARFFWQTVVNNHTWVMGGNSTGEHFFPVTEFEKRITNIGGPESCNSVNMLRLTEVLYTDYAEMEKVDYYEKVLFNHILSNYDPHEGMCTYYTSMRPGHYKIYGTPFDSFWCCTGTGMEMPAKFGQMIYAHHASDLFVNLFIPSAVKWREKGIELIQSTSFPDQDFTELVVQTRKSQSFTLNIRHPYWVQTGYLPVWINGEQVTVSSKPGEYLKINRKWKNGDKVKVQLPATLIAVPLKGSDAYAAILYGPVVLAAEIDNAGLEEEDFRSARRTVATKEVPLTQAPVLIGSLSDVQDCIQRKATGKLTFVCSGPAVSRAFELIPFNRIHFNRYALYFRHYSSKDACQQELQRYSDEEKRVEKLDEITVDRVIIRSDDSEKAHHMEAIKSSKGGEWRHAVNGGYFMYQLTILPDQKQSLYLSFLGSDSGARIFDILADGTYLATIDHTSPNPDYPDGLYGQTIPIPEEYTKGKHTITIKLQARRENTAGGLFDLRIIQSE